MEEQEVISLEFFGKIPGKKNRYKRRKGGGMFIDKALNVLLDNLLLQVPGEYRDLKLQHPDVDFYFFFADKRRAGADVDNMATTLIDVLVKQGVLYNDNVKRFNGKKTIHPAVFEGDIDRAMVELRPRKAI